jgi:hypothetical protein
VNTYDLGTAVWHKSSRSNGQGNCVEVAFLPEGGVAVRNSRDPDGSVLIFTSSEYDAFVEGVAAGELRRP